MATEWMKVGMDVVTGGAAGVVDQVVQNRDDKRAEEKLAAGEKLGIMAQYGTYFNYGVPLLAVVATAMGWLRGDWASRAVTAGSVLAGRKVTWQLTKKKELPGYALKWQRAPELEQRRQLETARQAAQAGARAGGAARQQLAIPQISEWEIPVISGGVILG